MANQSKTARSTKALLHALNLSQGQGLEIQFRAQLNLKIVETVKQEKLTHEEVAKLAKASRTRVTAILNGNTQGISTDLLLRVLTSLGVGVEARFRKIKLAA